MLTTDNYDKAEEQRHQSEGTTHQKDFHPVQFILRLILIVACIVLLVMNIFLVLGLR